MCTAQTQYAMTILRAHGLSEWTSHRFRSVAVAKITYASSVWSGLVNKHDEQQIDAFLWRNKKCKFCQQLNKTSHLLKNSVIQQSSRRAQQLFDKIQHNKHNLSTTYFRHPRLPHSATISGEDHILSSFLNALDTLWTLTLWLEYYIKTFTDAVI